MKQSDKYLDDKKDALMEQVKELINAMASGKTLDIESSFNEIMAAKVVDAIDAKRTEIASNLFASNESIDESTKEQIEEAYHASGTVDSKHKFHVKYDDFPSHNDIAKQNPHLGASHVNAIHDHISDHADDDFTNTKSKQGNHNVHVTRNSGSMGD